ncbi:hypothetical protein Tco_0596110 [Tanacetum coccineum]
MHDRSYAWGCGASELLFYDTSMTGRSSAEKEKEKLGHLANGHTRSNLAKILDDQMQKNVEKFAIKSYLSGKMMYLKDCRSTLEATLEVHREQVYLTGRCKSEISKISTFCLHTSFLIMRNKPGMDSLSFDELYNNLRVFENDVKGSTASSSNLQNVAFVSENTNNTNEVSTAYGVSNTSGHNSKHDNFLYSLLASQSSCPQLDHEDLDQVDEYDLEEMDLKWQVAMISMRIKKFYKKTGRKL